VSDRISRLYPPRVLDRSEYEPRRPSTVTLADLVIAAYPDPEPYSTAEAFARFNHDDLAAMTLDELDRERWRARNRLAYDQRPSAWLFDRIARLDALAARRRRPSR
jgi:hypothetical protein